MKLEKLVFTETELISYVSTFYNAPLTLDKAIKIFELEFGVEPEIMPSEREEYVTDEWCREQGYPWFINSKAITFMKELQESGVTNMLESTPYIMNALGYDKKMARELLMTYITDYEKFYHPENLI
jgi:hypothetical protein